MGIPRKFWMVWVNNTPTTQHRHPTYELAREEAERIARQSHNIGEKVYVLEALDWRSVEPQPLTTIKL